jgi:hypothetical protein
MCHTYHTAVTVFFSFKESGVCLRFLRVLFLSPGIRSVTVSHCTMVAALPALYYDSGLKGLNRISEAGKSLPKGLAHVKRISVWHS